MSIREQIDVALRQARIGRDERTRNVIGMLKAKLLMELKSGSGRAEDDALWLEILTAYAKQARKTVAELEPLGERATEALAETRFELEFCGRFLPSKLDEAATEALVRRLAAEHGVQDPKQAGRLMGLIMKAHKDEVDGDLVRKAVERVLASGG